MKSLLAISIAFFVGAVAAAAIISWHQIYFLGHVDPKFSDDPSYLFFLGLLASLVISFCAAGILAVSRVLAWRLRGRWPSEPKPAAVLGLIAGIILYVPTLVLPLKDGDPEFYVWVNWAYSLFIPVALGAGLLRKLESGETYERRAA